jgi:hypothetical protein
MSRSVGKNKIHQELYGEKQATDSQPRPRINRPSGAPGETDQMDNENGPQKHAGKPEVRGIGVPGAVPVAGIGMACVKTCPAAAEQQP